MTTVGVHDWRAGLPHDAGETREGGVCAEAAAAHGADLMRGYGVRRAISLRWADAARGRLRSLVSDGMRRDVVLYRGEHGVLTLEWGGVAPPGAAFFRIGTRIGPIVLADPSRLVRLLTGLEPSDAVTPGPGREVVERALLGRLARALWDDAGACHALYGADRPPPGYVPMRLVVSGRDVSRATVAALGWAEPRTWAQWLAHPGWAPGAIARTPAGRCVLDLPVIVGATELDAVQLRSLEVGDVLPLARACFDTTGLGVLDVGGGLAMSVRFEDDGPAPLLRFLGWRDHDGAAAHAVAGPSGEVDPTAGPEGVTSIPVTFVGGRLALRIEDLVGLAPDATLPMREPVSARVRMLVGEQVVAIGDLVDLAGRLAVELVAVGRAATGPVVPGG